MSVETSAISFSRAAIRGTAWRYLTFFSGKLMLLISTIILARLLSKDDFGVVGFAVTTIGFLDVMSDLGVGPALIYHPDDENTSTTAFWLGLLIATALLALTWISAPLVGLFFQDPRAIPVTRILALTYPLNALGAIHQTRMQKKLAFGQTFLPNLLQSIGKGLGSILLALLGLGAWSLIGGQLGGVLVGVIAFWAASRWQPSFNFNLPIARSLIGYGVKIVWVDLLGILLLNLDYLLVGRYLGAVSLGIYTLAFRVPDLLILQFARTLSGVIFPIYTRMRDVPGSLRKGFAQTTRYISLVTIPLGVGLALVAQPFVLTVFSEKWIEAVPVVRAIAIYAMFLSLAYNAGSVYKAEGRPQVLTWLGLIRLAVLLPGLYWATASAQSIVMVGWVQAIVAFLGGLLNLVIAGRLLDLSPADLFAALRPALVAVFFLALAVVPVLFATQATAAWVQLLAASLAGALAYGLALWFFLPEVVQAVIRQVRSALGRA
jgi:O-antigen/teichoic acid export membrane protein